MQGLNVNDRKTYIYYQVNTFFLRMSIHVHVLRIRYFDPRFMHFVFKEKRNIFALNIKISLTFNDRSTIRHSFEYNGAQFKNLVNYMRLHRH